MPNRSDARPAEPSRRQKAHLRRDQIQSRWLLAGFGVLIVVVAVVLTVGILHTYVYRQYDSLGTVYGEAITVGQYQKEFRYELWSALDSYQQEIDLAKSGGLTEAQKSFYSQAQGVWSQYQDSPTTQQNVLLFLEEAVIARHEAKIRGITVSDAEVEAKIQSQFGYVPEPTLTALALATASPTQTRTPTATDTPGGPTPMPSLTPSPLAPTFTATADTHVFPSEDKYRESYTQFLGRLLAKAGMSEQDYRERVRTELLMGKVRLAIMATMPRVQTQLHLQRIVFVDATSAQAAAARLAAGEDWVAVTRGTSIDISTRDLAGDLGWVPLGNLDPVSAAVVVALNMGDVSKPIAVTTTDGDRWYIYRVLEKGQREVSDADMSIAQSNYYAQWFSQSQNDKTVMSMSGLTSDIIPSDPKPSN